MFKPKIFIAGHKGMVGSALVRFLKNKKVKIITKDRSELDLLNQHEVQSFFKNEKIEVLSNAILLFLLTPLKMESMV